MGSKQSKRSPLKNNPLRGPGQSTDETLQDLLIEKIVFPIIFAVLVVVLAVYHELCATIRATN